MFKVGDNDRDHEGESEDAAECAETADKLAGYGLGHNITVPDRGPGDDSPPKSRGNAVEIGPVSEFGVIHCRTEYDHANGDDHQHQHHFVSGRLHGQGKDLKAIWISSLQKHATNRALDQLNSQKSK